jgi:putative restriction endonuclease
MKQYTRNSQFPNPTDISNPFWHLQGDGFWHLIQKTAVAEGSTPSKRWLKENVTYGHFDDDLWVLLQSKVWRQKLRDYIVEHKLTDDNWLGKIAAEGLGAIAVLLLAA